MKDPGETPAPGRPRRGGWLVGLALLTVSSVACVLLLEFAVRLCFPFFSPKTQIPFRLNPEGVPLGHAGETVRQATPKGDYDTIVHFNVHGFRDTKDLRNATETNWFALGDSFTMGWGVDEEQRYSNQLERMLKTNNLSSSIYNIAIPENILGYAKLLRYAQSRGAKIRRLVVGICMENDLRDYQDGRCDWDPVVAQSQGQRISKKELLRSWLRRHSAFYTAISFSVQRSAACRKVLEQIGVARDVEHLTGANSGDETVLVSSRDQVAKLVTGYDALVLIIPSRRLWHGSNMETERRVHERFVALLREKGLTVVDPKPAFERGGKPLDYYFATDPHWNPQGHLVAAEELFRAIKSIDSGPLTTANAESLARP